MQPKDTADNADAGERDSHALVRTTPGAQGLSAAGILDLLRAMDADGLELHSFMLASHGQVVAEGWWHPYTQERVHMLHSVTKAFTATGVGLAVHEGLFGLDDAVLDYFPERFRPETPAHLRKMRVIDLLTQTSGHDHGTSGSVWRGISTSWIDEFMKIPVPHKPGTRFQYSSATSFMLSALVTRTSGVSLHDYLAPRLFAPLGMRSVKWDVGPEGINPGGNGASAVTEDLLKLTVLHAADGVWNGQRILPEGWVTAAGEGAADRPYGLHWWALPGRPGFYAFGAFGQYGFVLPELGLALATTAAVRGSISRPDVGIPPLVWQYLPQIAAGADPHNRSEEQLRDYLSSRKLSPVRKTTPQLAAAGVNGLRFMAEPNEDDIKSIVLEIEPTCCRLVLEVGDRKHWISASLDGEWLQSRTTLPGAGLHHGYERAELVTAASGGWSNANEFTLQCQYVETAFRDTFVLRFEVTALTLERSVNVNGAGMHRPLVRAHAI